MLADTDPHACHVEAHMTGEKGLTRSVLQKLGTLILTRTWNEGLI